MPRNSKKAFMCRDCGYDSSKWMGRCPACGAWNAMVEMQVDESYDQTTGGAPGVVARVQPITEVHAAEVARIGTNLPELDRVLGGGLVPGSLVLVGGDPGIGKSTLLLQVAAGQAEAVLYISGEESAPQLRMRAERLGAMSERLLVMAGTDVRRICEETQSLRPRVVIVDSIQTMSAAEAPGLPGSIVQVRACAAALLRLAKETGIPVIIVGHITKAGALAGPKVLEHMVDTVLYFEGEAHYSFRILRAVKNRFGSTNEVALFEMGDAGLRELSNPSEVFLSGRAVGSPGSMITAAMEGTRPVLVEVQALVGGNPTGGTPRRLSSGVDPNRVAVMLAVLERRLGLNCGGSDVYVQAIGGVRLLEPAADLGILGAIASSYRNRPIDSGAVTFGEVGLSGEVRGVARAEMRAREAARLGFKRLIVPRSNLTDAGKAEGVKVVGVRTVAEMLEALLTDESN